MVDILRNVAGSLLGLDKSNNLVLGGTKIYCGHDSKLDAVVDIAALAGQTTTAAESLGVAVSASASVNTAALNAALALGGRITLFTPGTFQLNAPLVYGSNTHLALGPKTILKQAAGTNQMMLQSAAAVAVAASQTTSTTLTWSSGLSCSVAWTAHGFTVGQAVWFLGANQNVYNGVFRVISVTDANNFVVNLRYVPAASPTGTTVAVAAVQNVVIEGGTWDYNQANNPSGVARGLMCLWFEGVADIVIRNVASQNAKKYAFGTCATLNLTAENLRVPVTASDGLKIYGPAYDTQVRGFTGITGDDGITVQTGLVPGFTTYQLANGDVLGCTIRDVDVTVTNTAVCVAGVYTADTDGFMDDVVFEGIRGRGGTSASGAGFRVQSANTYTAGNFGKITIRDVAVADVTAQIQLGANVLTGDLISIEDCRVNLESLTAGNFLLISTLAVINKVAVNGCDLYQSTWPTATAYPFLLQGTINQVTLSKCLHKSGGSANSRFCQLTAASLIKTLSIQDVTSVSSDTLCLQAATNTPWIRVDGCHFEGAAAITVNASCNVALSGGNHYVNASNGVIRFGATATVNLYTDGTNKLDAGNWLATPAGTPTFNPHGWDISVDVGATGVTKTNSNYCFNNGSGRGTLVQNRYVTCDGTSWYQLNDTTKTF